MDSSFKRYARFGLALFVAVLLIVAFSASASAAGPMYYTVQPGQTLYSISAMYGVSVWAMACANGLSNPNYIYAGMVLRIPYGGYGNCGQSYGYNYGQSYGNNYGHMPYYPQQGYNGYQAGYHQGGYDCFYRVQWGDTLYSIAWRYGTSYWALSSANHLYNPNYIYAGMVLRIPGCN
jgi:LysM repeat protein